MCGHSTGNNKEVHAMGWLLWVGLATLYVVLLFTVCVVCFRKGHKILGIVGIFLPFLWLVGAALPATEESMYMRPGPS
jgi:hypothetical protein